MKRMFFPGSFAVVCAAVLCTGTAVATDADAPRQAAVERQSLELTMRIIEDPDAIAAESVTRRLSLPPPNVRDAPSETGNDAGESRRGPPGDLGHDRAPGEQATQRARDMAQQAREQREDFGRSRAEHMRPDPPETPERPRPPGRP